jgi:MerR family transcriptional regulator, light-induced transcriptional regulator
VSEPSLKRWADEGRLEVERTAGGHQRIRRAEVIGGWASEAVEMPRLSGVLRLSTPGELAGYTKGRAAPPEVRAPPPRP